MGVIINCLKIEWTVPEFKKYDMMLQIVEHR